MNFLVYFLILVITLYFWYQWKYGERNKILAKIPAPPSWPLLGHISFFFFKSPDEILKSVMDIVSKQPLVFRMDLTIFESMIFIHDVKIVETLLSSPKYIQKSEFYNSPIFSKWLETGLLTSNGQKWHQRRKIITPAFHFKILEQFVEVMDKHGDIFVEKIKNLNGKTVDVFPLISLYALDVICGEKFNLKFFKIAIEILLKNLLWVTN